ncbi:ribonuclease H-like domain-containing protein [Paraclostridium bifermentans]|uniref:ribonuclease H-like domain-containing protein n=1 Tax=Paraclostridium bifermentans TaxID=1490 RepID=UPI00038D8F21|nr:ribonuclease H-like domain-containing protein [Paraclostridium bifermentans]EQK48157.1 putative 3'-5' exonuclease related to the exonuclease domain of PolB family protein [[Clostridium] bifermentans ATCC 19299] [Paraclostridium bifermentans ATCC 19299]MCE9676200.1 ribonuclease H-like domain-containing protein [Paraclostridium bifermentans]
MEVITKTIDNLIDIPKNHFVFDIETTGLIPKYCKVILIGVLYNLNNKTIIKQYFAESEEEEKDLLLKFINDIKTFDHHITFNGVSFDIPFLNSRFNSNDIDFSIDKCDDIDILRIVKPFKEKLSLSDCKLKTIEKYMGIKREDTISGKESVELYKNFVISKDISLKEKILLHNYEDIYYLGKIYNIKNIIDESLDYIDININNLNYKVLLSKYKITKSVLHLNFISRKKFELPLNIFRDTYTISTEENILNIFINLNKGIDSNGNTIFFYKLGSIIPIKFNTDFIVDNINALSKFLISKEL